MVVEPLGGHTIIDLHVGSQTIKVRLAGQHQHEEGSTLHLRPDVRQLHLFPA
jgi:ABC-type sugar transport system ATPase subunit